VLHVTFSTYRHPMIFLTGLLGSPGLWCRNSLRIGGGLVKADMAANRRVTVGVSSTFKSEISKPSIECTTHIVTPSQVYRERARSK